MRFADPSLDKEIPATLVTEGPAKGWMRMPLPNPTTLACDYVVEEGHCPWAAQHPTFCPRCQAPWYAPPLAPPLGFHGLPEMAPS